VDRLTEMLKAQRALQVDSFKQDPCLLEGEERIEFIRWNVLALEDELHEMLQETGWKPWATSRHVNADAAIKEMIDAWHFFMNLLLAIMGPEIGIDLVVGRIPEEVFTDIFVVRYLDKVKVNAQRQKDGYDGLTGKCVKCHRDLAEIKPVSYRFRPDHSPIMACPCGEELPT
jgi:dimeric dUTPase (all-alpha-NTP-PPase superfamily)